jgi:lysyl-tRNA synthetase class 2
VELDPTQYPENRKKWVQALRDNNTNPYPHKFERTLRIDHFLKTYGEQQIAENSFKEEVTESVTGRIMSLRPSGAKLIFLHIHGDDAKL